MDQSWDTDLIFLVNLHQADLDRLGDHIKEGVVNTNSWMI